MSAQEFEHMDFEESALAQLDSLERDMANSRYSTPIRTISSQRKGPLNPASNRSEHAVSEPAVLSWIEKLQHKLDSDTYTAAEAAPKKSFLEVVLRFESMLHGFNDRNDVDDLAEKIVGYLLRELHWLCSFDLLIVSAFIDMIDKLGSDQVDSWQGHYLGQFLATAITEGAVSFLEEESQSDDDCLFHMEWFPIYKRILLPSLSHLRLPVFGARRVVYQTITALSSFYVASSASRADLASEADPLCLSLLDLKTMVYTTRTMVHYMPLLHLLFCLKEQEQEQDALNGRGFDFLDGATWTRDLASIWHNTSNHREIVPTLISCRFPILISIDAALVKHDDQPLSLLFSAVVFDERALSWCSCLPGKDQEIDIFDVNLKGKKIRIDDSVGEVIFILDPEDMTAPLESSVHVVIKISLDDLKKMRLNLQARQAIIE